MATFLWSSLVNGQTIAFNPTVDVLRFDDSTISAASIGVSGTATTALFAYGGKSVTLEMNWYSITTDNVRFDDQSLLLVGDNTTGIANDDNANTLVGGNGNDQLIGLGGDDLLVGGSGDDRFFLAGAAGGGTPGLDTIFGGPGEDQIVFLPASTPVVFNFADVERIVGTNNGDTITIKVGITFDGNGGNDVLNGAAGNGVETTVAYATAASGVNVNLASGIASDGLGGTDTFINVDGVEGSRFNDVITGGSDSRDANGNLFEFFQGMAGNDLIDGQGGVDRVDYTRSPAGVTVDLGAGTAQDGWGGTDTLLNIEQVRGSSFNDTLIGNSGDNKLEGMGGNDVVVYTGGMDVMDGGSGMDTADFSHLGSALFVNLLAPSGIEAWTTDSPTVTTGIWRAIADLINVENIVGTSYSDQLFGDNANNVFTYTGGFDTIDGRGGIDTVDFSPFGSAVWVSLAYESAWTMDLPTLTGGTWREIGKLTNIENLADTLYSDKLFGNDANNVFSYSGGLDSVDGAGGSDTLDYSQFGSAVWVNLGYASAWTRDVPGVPGHEIGRLTAIENVIGTSAADSLTGDWGNNRIEAGAGNDVLGYSGGYDVLDGGTGIDTLDFSGFGAAVWVALSGAGIPGTEAWTMDLPTVSGGTWREIADVSNVENLVGTLYSDKLYGDAGNNVLTYTGGYDVLDGGAGNDTADFSRFGSAVWVNLNYEGSNAWTMDQPTLSGGTWREIANVAHMENLVGTSGNDLLAGDGNANRIEGGGGADQLSGGGGADRFDYNALTDAGDTISDFTPGLGGDVLDIKDVLLGYNPGLSNISDFVELASSGGNTVVNVNADGIGSDFVSLTTLQGVALTGTLLNDMLAQGNLAVS